MDLASKGFTRSGCGSNVLAGDNSSSFPLHDAAGEGRAHVVRLLLERGHSVSALDGEGLRASERARVAGHFALADELEDREAGQSSGSSKRSEVERLAIKELIGLVQGKTDAVTALIAARHVHVIDGKGDTPLHICAAQGRLQFCDQLIKAGADAAAKNFEGKMPHDRAAENGHDMVAALIRSLLPEASPESAVAPVPSSRNVKVAPPTPEAAKEAAEEAFDFDDFDLDFDGEQEAEDFHRDIERDDYVASFDAVEGRVTSLWDEDGENLEFDDLGDGGFRINGDDILRELPQTAEHADAATFRSFNDVRKGRWSATQTPAPTTRFHAISEDALLRWVESVTTEDACTGEDVDALIGEIRGSFDAEIVRGNLVSELTNLGLMETDDDCSEEVFVSHEIRDPEDIADLLSSICNGSNMRPGMEFMSLSAREEARLFREMATSQEEICRTLVSDAMLVSIVVMLGERIEAGSVDPSLLTELEVQRGQEAPDAVILSASLAYLVGYQTLLEEDDITSEDRAHALDAVSAMKLSRKAMELIAKGVQANPELADLRQKIESLLATLERYRREILLQHMSLVRRQASRRNAYIEDIEDLVQDGVFGLMRSVDKFEADRGNRFMTYCQFGVRQAIGRALDDTGHLIRLPSHVAVRVRKAKAAVEYLPMNTERSLLDEVVREKAQLSLRKFEILENLQELPSKFDEFQIAPVEDGSSVEKIICEAQLCREIRLALSRLDHRKVRILRKRFGFGDLDEHTLEECGQEFGVTRERIRQVEAKALKSLKHPSRSRKLREFL